MQFSRHWESVLAPFVQAVRPRRIVEIGTGEGALTEHLIAYCRAHGTDLHTIDPKPSISAPLLALLESHGYTLHSKTSLEVLPALPPFDVVLVDGDHNWYTVYHELQHIFFHATTHGTVPLVALHDVEWPYGRRDLYHDPETIPAEYRQPYACAGLDIIRDVITEGPGLNMNMFHAITSNTPRNGVLTAIEQFRAESAVPLAYLQIPGGHGIGILTPQQLLLQNPELALLVRQFAVPERMAKHIAALETERLCYRREYEEERLAHAQKHRELMEAKHTAALLQNLVRCYENTLNCLREELTDMTRKFHCVTHSRSWRATHILRMADDFIKKHFGAS